MYKKGLPVGTSQVGEGALDKVFDEKIIITAQKDIVMGQENHIPKVLRKWQGHLCKCQQDLTLFPPLVHLLHKCYAGDR